MKFFISTIIMLCIFSGAMAQGEFKTFNYTFREMQSDGKGGEYGNASSRGGAPGTILIDIKDSVVQIQFDKPGVYGAHLKTYKFTSMDPEQTSIYDDGTTVKSVKVHGTGPEGKPYVGRLARQTETGKKPIMQFSITYDSNNVETFVCDYEKDIYE